MRLALLGVDDEMLAVAGAAVRSGQDQIVMIDALAPRSAEAARVAPQAQLVTDWQSVLDSGAVDAVLVAADQPALRTDQLRVLIQIAMPVLVSHPLNLSMLDCYELDMIRRESRGVVLPYLPARWHPAVIELQALIDNGTESPIGAIEQVVLERLLDDRRREVVLRQFARDADLLQFLAGDATKLHALGSAATAAHGPYGNLTVQMTSDRDLVCRWTVAPIERELGGRLNLTGSRGRASLWMPADSSAWELELRPAGDAASATIDEYPTWDPAAAALEKLAVAMQGVEIDPSWADASRAVELTETIDSSLARGRTIDLHHEEFTDVGTFKGTMASVGCGLLMAGLALTVVVAVLDMVAVQAGWNRLAAVLDGWPYLLLAVCGIFLLLQLVVIVARPRKQASDAKPDC